MKSESDFFSYFTITVEEMNASLSAVIDGRDYQKPICICGHPMAWHSDTGGRHMCSFASTYCRCQTPLAVIATSDLRFFKKLTRRPGSDHALTLGCFSAIKAGKTVRDDLNTWIGGATVKGVGMTMSFLNTGDSAATVMNEYTIKNGQTVWVRKL